MRKDYELELHQLKEEIRRLEASSQTSSPIPRPQIPSTSGGAGALSESSNLSEPANLEVRDVTSRQKGAPPCVHVLFFFRGGYPSYPPWYCKSHASNHLGLALWGYSRLVELLQLPSPGYPQRVRRKPRFFRRTLFRANVRHRGTREARRRCTEKHWQSYLAARPGLPRFRHE